MLFKRKNINADLQQKVAEIEEQKSTTQDEAIPNIVQESKNQGTETLQERRKLETEAKEHAVEEAKRQLEQELSVKHYYHQRLLETLDL